MPDIIERPKLSDLAEKYTKAMRRVERLDELQKILKDPHVSIHVSSCGASPLWEYMSNALRPYLPQAVAEVEKKVRHELAVAQQALERAQKVI